MSERETGCLMSSENQAFRGFISMQSAKNANGLGFFSTKHSCSLLTPKENYQHHLTVCVGWYF